MAFQHHDGSERSKRNQSDFVKRFAEQMTQQYAREFPHGRLGATDDGELTYAIATDRRKQAVIIRFAHPTEWIGLDMDSAIKLRDQLSQRIVELQTLAKAATGGEEG